MPPTGCSATRSWRRSWKAGRRLSRAAPRHRHRRQPRGRPLPRADQAGGAGPASRRGAGRRCDRRRSTACCGQVATAEQRAELDASALDEYLLDEERERGRRSGAGRRPRRALARGRSCRAAATGLALSASDLDLYLTCPLKYKFARVFAHPAGADDQPALRDPHPQRPRALPQRSASRAAGEPRTAACDRLMRPVRGGLAPVGLRRHRRRAPVPRPRRRGPAPLLGARARCRGASRSGSSATSTSRSAPTTSAAGSTGSTASPDGEHELIDYKTGERRKGPARR